MAAEQTWKITVDGKTYEGVRGLRFTPKIRHISGGRTPISVTVTATANGSPIGSTSGTINTPGQTITLSPIEWYPAAEGSYTIVFQAQAVDPDGRTGTAQATLTAVVETYIPPPEIEIIVEVA